MVSQWNSSGISSQDSPHCSSAMLMFNDNSWGSKDNKKNASQMLISSLSMQRDLEQDNGHSSGLDQRRGGTLLVKTVHKVNGTELQSK